MLWLLCHNTSFTSFCFLTTLHLFCGIFLVLELSVRSITWFSRSSVLGRSLFLWLSTLLRFLYRLLCLGLCLWLFLLICLQLPASQTEVWQICYWHGGFKRLTISIRNRLVLFSCFILDGAILAGGGNWGLQFFPLRILSCLSEFLIRSMRNLTVCMVPLLTAITTNPVFTIHVCILCIREIHLRAVITSQIFLVKLDAVFTECDHSFIIEGDFLCLNRWSLFNFELRKWWILIFGGRGVFVGFIGELELIYLAVRTELVEAGVACSYLVHLGTYKKKRI